MVKTNAKSGENTKYGIAPFHNQVTVLLVQVVEALAKDAETLEANKCIYHDGI